MAAKSTSVTYSDLLVQPILCPRTGSWYCFTVKATPTDGSPAYYRWALSRHRDQHSLYALWQDKNRLGRKFETRYCQSRSEAVECAQQSLARK